MYVIVIQREYLNVRIYDVYRRASIHPDEHPVEHPDALPLSYVAGDRLSPRSKIQIQDPHHSLKN